MVSVVRPENLGTEFDVSAPDINIKLVPGQLTKTASGEIGLDPMAIAAAETLTTLNYDPALKTLTYKDEDGVDAVIDLSLVAVDINLTGGSYDVATFVMTLTDSDGTTVTVDLADLKKTAIVDSESIGLTGTGEASDPLKAGLIVDAIAGNPLAISAAGVRVIPTLIPDFWSAKVGGANAVENPDGVDDLTQRVRRDGFVGLFQEPSVALHTTSFGAAIVNYSGAEPYNTSNQDHTIRFAQGCPQVAVVLHDPNETPGHILVLSNSSDFKQEVIGDVHNLSGVGRIDTIHPETSHTIQSVEGVWVVIDRDIPVSGAIAPVVFDVGVNGLVPAPTNATPPASYLAADKTWKPIGSHFSSATATANTEAPPNGVADLTEKLRREGAIGLGIDALTTLDVNGSHSFKANFILASATPYVVVPDDSTIAINGSVSQDINFPDPSLFPRRILTVRLEWQLTNARVNILSAAANLEHVGGTRSNRVVLDNRSVASVTYQAVSGQWRVIDWTERAYYQTDGYNPPAAGSQTFNGTGLPQPAPGTPFQIPAGVTSWSVVDGNYTPLIALPIANNATGRFSVYPTNAPSFPTTISTLNTDLPQDTVILSGVGRSMHFEWSNGLWRWVYAPEVPAIASSPDDVVDVSGATLPIAFPVATIPGAPVFAPNTPVAANTLYVFPNGQTAVWNGTQYTSYVAPGNSHWSSIISTANSPAPPNGVADLTESLRREGNTGFGVRPTIQLHTTGFGAKFVETLAPNYAIGATDHTIRLVGNAPQTVTLPPLPADDRIFVIVNYGDTAKTLSGTNAITNTLTTVIPPHSSMTIQGGNGTWCEIDRYVQTNLSGKSHQTIALVANTGFVFTHNLNLVDPKAYTINAFDSTGQSVSLRQTGQTANAITLTSNIALSAIEVTVMG